MRDYSKDFGPFDGKIWLNCASEGPVPHVSAEAAQEAITWKIRPFELTHKRFAEVPQQLKIAIARLVNVDKEDVILGNSATYGIHLFANGIPLKEKDEVLLMQNDFPVDILPWLALANTGVRVLQIKPRECVIQPEEIIRHISPATKVVCLAHVHTFTGHVVNIEEIGRICRKKGIIFLVNFSQSVGTIPVDLAKLPVDGMTTAGFKWLCGPYGTGFCWMTPDLRSRLEYNQAFWVNVLSPKDLQSESALSLPQQTGAKKYDVFGTANFFNFRPLTASIEYLLDIGIDTVYRHNNDLAGKIVSGLDPQKYTLISPKEADARSMLVVFSHKQRERNPEIFQALLGKGIYLALWKGNLRASAHIYNTAEEVDQFLRTVNSA